MNVTVADIKANLSNILRKAAKGEEINVTKHGKPYVKIAAANPVKKKLPRLGAFEGEFTLPNDFDEIPTGFEKYIK